MEHEPNLENNPDSNQAAGCLIVIAGIITAVIFFLENTRVFLP
jgi:hypothetical protein